MPETKTYSGGCHCGKVRFEVALALADVLSCNCSICSKRGSLLAFAAPEQFTLSSGETDLRDYQFGKKRIHHLFCANCGTSSFGRSVRPDGKPMVSINVRCLDDVDVAALPVRHFDGKSR